MKTLLEVLHKADAIELDGTFVRHFHLEIEECEEPEDIALDVEFDIYAYQFYKREIEEAEYNAESNSWEVKDGDTYVTLKCYNVEEIKA